MGKNIIVFDIETKHTFDEVGGGRNLEKLGVTVIGTYFYSNDSYRIFREADIPALEEIFSKKPLLVGFNIKRFDIPVLKPYMKMTLEALPCLDVMDELVKVLGHRVSLDSVAKATLGIQKSGNGLDAIKYHRNGEWDKLEKYCLDDVRITKEVYEYGAKNGELFYTSKFGPSKGRAPVGWKIVNPLEEEAQYSLL